LFGSIGQSLSWFESLAGKQPHRVEICWPKKPAIFNPRHVPGDTQPSGSLNKPTFDHANQDVNHIGIAVNQGMPASRMGIPWYRIPPAAIVAIGPFRFR
jgi:hypothetical protein